MGCSGKCCDVTACFNTGKNKTAVAPSDVTMSSVTRGSRRSAEAAVSSVMSADRLRNTGAGGVWLRGPPAARRLRGVPAARTR